MIEAIALGVAQGIFEWLPVSSEAIIVLLKTYFFQGEGLSSLIDLAIFLHLGTFLAALVYLRKDVVSLIKTIFTYDTSDEEQKTLLRFLLISSLATGVVGYLVLFSVSRAEETLTSTGQWFVLFIGVLLLITAWFQFKKSAGLKSVGQLKTSDALFAGTMQGFAALPGLSRSGLTIASLLLKKFDDETALRASFLMSLPAVLGANILFSFDELTNLTTEMFVMIGISFVIGLLTIHALLKLARKIQFGYFVLIFGILTILAVII